MVEICKALAVLLSFQQESCVQLIICSTASSSSSLRSMTPEFASENEPLQAPSKKALREHKIALCTAPEGCQTFLSRRSRMFLHRL